MKFSIFIRKNETCPVTAGDNTYYVYRYEGKINDWNIYNPESLFGFHYIPSEAQWLNLIEPWFGSINRRALNNSDYKTHDQLIVALCQAIFYGNANDKPYRCKKADVA